MFEPDCKYDIAKSPAIFSIPASNCGSLLGFSCAFPVAPAVRTTSLSSLSSLLTNKYAVKAKRNKGMKNAGHGLNPGRRYWCHASDSLTEPSGPATSQWAHIPISLHYEFCRGWYIARSGLDHEYLDGWIPEESVILFHL